MDTGGFAAGMGVAAFWLFIAAVSVAGIWSDQRNKQEKQRTIREMLARSGDLNQEAADRLLAMLEGDRRAEAQSTKDGLSIAYRILFGIAPGLLLLGLFVGEFMKLVGVAALVACVGGGLMFAAQGIRVEDDPGRGR